MTECLLENEKNVYFENDVYLEIAYACSRPVIHMNCFVSKVTKHWILFGSSKVIWILYIE